MSKGMLGTLPLPEVQGPMNDLEQKLAGPEGRRWLGALKRFLRKETPWHIIDCDAEPHIPPGWQIVAHEKMGLIDFDPSKLVCHVEPEQKSGGSIYGEVIRQRIGAKPVLNACVLDYLLLAKCDLPGYWKNDIEGYTKRHFFWGTIYRDSEGRLCVRCLRWKDVRWIWESFPIDCVWDSLYTAVLLAQ